MAKAQRSGTNAFSKFLSPEQKEHAALVRWIRLVGKTWFWFHPMNEGKRTPYERYLWSIMGGERSVPDFMFFDHHNGYCGLAIELKPTGTKIIKENGEFYADKKAQAEKLEELRRRGWKAEFAAGFDEAQKLISEYYAI